MHSHAKTTEHSTHRRNTLHTATHWRNTLQHAATTYNTCTTHTRTWDMQHTATHCNTLQHTATHCNTLQHTDAPHCHTLQQHIIHALRTQEHPRDYSFFVFTTTLFVFHNRQRTSRWKPHPIVYLRWYFFRLFSQQQFFSSHSAAHFSLTTTLTRVFFSFFSQYRIWFSSTGRRTSRSKKKTPTCDTFFSFQTNKLCFQHYRARLVDDYTHHTHSVPGKHLYEGYVYMCFLQICSWTKGRRTYRWELRPNCGICLCYLLSNKCVLLTTTIFFFRQEGGARIVDDYTHFVCLLCWFLNNDFVLFTTKQNSTTGRHTYGW